MSFQEIKKLVQYTFAPNGQQVLQLPRTSPYKKLQIRMDGEVAARAIVAGETYGAAVEDSPASLLKLLQFRVVGRVNQGYIKTLTGTDLIRMAKLHTNAGIENVNHLPVGANPAHGAAPGNYKFAVTFDLDFALSDASNSASIFVPTGRIYVPAEQTILDPYWYNPIEMTLQWGDIPELNSGVTSLSTPIFTFNYVNVNVYSEEAPKFYQKRVKFQINRQQFIDGAVSGATADLRIDLPRGNKIRNIILQSIKNGVLDDTLVNTVKVVYNENYTPIDTIAWAALQLKTAKDLGIPYTNIPVGLAEINFDGHRDLQGLLDVTNTQIVNNIRISANVKAPVGDPRLRAIVQEITVGG